MYVKLSQLKKKYIYIYIYIQTCTDMYTYMCTHMYIQTQFPSASLSVCVILKEKYSRILRPPLGPVTYRD